MNAKYTKACEALEDLRRELDYAITSMENDIEIDQLVDELEYQTGTIQSVIEDLIAK